MRIRQSAGFFQSARLALPYPQVDYGVDLLRRQEETIPKSMVLRLFVHTGPVHTLQKILVVGTVDMWTRQIQAGRPVDARSCPSWRRTSWASRQPSVSIFLAANASAQTLFGNRRSVYPFAEALDKDPEGYIFVLVTPFYI